MAYICQLVEQTGQPVLFIRTITSIGRLPQVLGEAYETIMKYLAEIGEYPCGAPFAAYHNMDAQELDVEAGFPVSKAFPGKDDIKSGEILAGKHVACLYTGPYGDCGPVYDMMTKWTAKNGFKPTGVAYEFYLNKPGEVPESELQTRIVFPLA